MKPILPSLREKKRYIIFEVISKEPVQLQKVSDTITDSLKKFFGEMESSKASSFLLANKWNRISQRGILRINHAFMDAAKACLCLIKEIGGEKVVVRSIVTSGTLKKASMSVKQ